MTLCCNTSAVAAALAVRADDPVARDGHANRIASDGTADGPGTFRIAQGPGYFPVGSGFPRGNRQQIGPHSPLEVGAFIMHFKLKLSAIAVKVLFKLANRVPDRFGNGPGSVP